MCVGGAEFQTPSANLTGFSSNVGSTASAFSSFDMAMMGISGFQALTKGFAAGKASSAEKTALLYKARVAQQNAELRQMEIEDAKYRGKKKQDALRRKYKQIKKAQLPGYAGKNILLGSGTPLDVLLSSGVVETADLGTLKEQQEREVFGLKVAKYSAESDASFMRQRGKAISPFRDFAGTILSSAAGSGMKYLAWKNQPVAGTRSSFIQSLGL